MGVFRDLVAVMVRLDVRVSFLSSFAAALATSPVIVEYDVASSARALRSSNNVFDSRLADLVRDADRADVQLSEFDAVSMGSSFLSSTTEPALVQKVAGMFPNTSLPAIRAAADVAMSHALFAHGFRAGEAGHVRDYNAPCPSGWSDHGDGDACDAPVSYDGPCGGTLHFGGLAAHEKMDIAKSCGIAFARLDGCAADFSAPCPVGWRLEGSGVCSAPVAYAGPCVRRKDFASLVAADKAWFQDVCGVQWPCRASWSSVLRPSAADACKEDFAKPCPSTWAESTGVCMAPAAYEGPCSVALAATAYTAEEKAAVSRYCGAPWPCSS